MQAAQAEEVTALRRDGASLTAEVARKTAAQDAAVQHQQHADEEVWRDVQLTL